MQAVCGWFLIAGFKTWLGTYAYSLHPMWNKEPEPVRDAILVTFYYSMRYSLGYFSVFIYLVYGFRKLRSLTLIVVVMKVQVKICIYTLELFMTLLSLFCIILEFLEKRIPRIVVPLSRLTNVVSVTHFTIVLPLMFSRRTIPNMMTPSAVGS